MSNPRSAIPPLNRQFQANSLITATVDYYQQTSQRSSEQSTPLRWLLQTLEDMIYVETLSDATNDTEATISDPEACCPVCFETYRKSHEEELIMPEPDGIASRRLLHERPLGLECGHVIGKACLRRIIDMRYAGVPKCPMCRGTIYTTISVIPLVRSSDNKPDIVGLLCCAIRLYILFKPRQPETHKALYEWVHDPTFEGRTLEEGQLFAEMRNAVDIWDEFGDRNMWGWLRARKKGDLPNEELGSARGVVGVGVEGVGVTYTAFVELKYSGAAARRYDDH